MRLWAWRYFSRPFVIWWRRLAACGLILVCFALIVQFLSTNYTTAFLLQNSDEVRATGGFLGSLVIIEHQGWRLRSQKFYDVYSLDAQIAQFPPAPAAVKHYLTGGIDQLHLQDSNWERDFPTSAAIISQLLVASGQPTPDFIVAVNTNLFTDFLAWSTDTFTDDAGHVLTAQNFTALARADHQLTSSQRQPKVRYLRALTQKVSAQVAHWPLGEKLTLLPFLWRQKNLRHIQIWSAHAFYQWWADVLGASGRLNKQRGCYQLYAVPSNVGINKSNHATDYQLTLQTAQHQAQLTITIDNHNLLNETALITERLHFANYQRLLLPPGVTASRIAVDGTPITDFDERDIADARGQSWHELGFLVITPEQARRRIEIDLLGERQRCWRISD